MFMHRIKLKNILSFGPDGMDLELKPLNVLIGPNGSGKSNLVEVIGLLQAAPKELTAPIIAGGGVSNWIWKVEDSTPPTSKPVSAEIEAELDYRSGKPPLRHRLAFTKDQHHLEVIDERLESETLIPSGGAEVEVHFEWRDGRPRLPGEDENPPGFLPSRRPRGLLPRPQLPPLYDRQKSILSLLRAPLHYPELTWLGDMYPRIRLYREWSFGRITLARLPQDAALPNDFLIEGGQNLGLMLNRLKREPAAKAQFLSRVRQLYEGIDDFDVIIEGGTVQVILQEGNNIVPAVRLSDGTLRYLCLLAILCHPTPPPLVCLEEPELGLHPDILPGLADLLREASERCQLIVTTHSDTLIDALTDTPESVVVCEKEKGQTRMKRLDKEELSHWLEKYRLGELWSSGELGGNRW